MTLAVDEVLTASGGQGFVSTVTLTKVGNTSPTALDIMFTSLGGGSNLAPTSVTYDGVAISLTSFSFSAGINAYYGSLIPPSSGTKNLVFTLPGATFKDLIVSAVFWSGDIDSISYSTRALDFADPVISVAKAASSALHGFVFDGSGGTITFLGDGTERVSASSWHSATQEPAQGTGVMNWKESTFEGDFAHNTTYVAAEIVAATAVSLGGTFQLMFGR